MCQIWSQITSNYLTFRDKKTCSFNTVLLFFEHDFLVSLFKFPTSPHLFFGISKVSEFCFIASRWRLQGTRTNTGDMSISTLQWWLCFPICVSIYIYIHRCFQKIWIPQNGWFIMENLIKMDDLWVPLFLETPIYNYNYWLIHYLQFFWEWHHWSETSFWRVKLPSPEGTLISSSLQRIQSHEWHIGAVLVQDRGWCGWHQSHWRYESWYLSAWHPLKKPDIFFNENSTILVEIQVWIIEVVDWPWQMKFGDLGG